MRAAQQCYRSEQAQAQAQAARLITAGKTPELFELQRDGLKLVE